MSTRCTACDVVTLSKRTIDERTGYMRAPVIIGRTGIQTYTRGELGLDGDPKATIRLMRTADEVFSKDTIDSFEDVPITDGHPSVSVTAENWGTLARGEVRNIGKQEGDLMGGHSLVKDGRLVGKVASGKSAVSCGYDFDLDLTPGEGFDGYQRNIRGNHVAIVDVARGGPACRIADHDTKETIMNTRKIAVDGLPKFEMDELAAEAVETHVKKLAADRDQVIADFSEAVDTHKTAIKAKDGELTTVKASIASKDTEIADLKAKFATATAIDVDALVTERTQVMDGAKKLAPDLEAKGTSLEIRKAAIAVACGDELNKVVCAGIFGDDGIDKATESQIKGAFTTLLALPKQRELAAQDAAMARTLTGNDSSIGGDGEVIGDDYGTETKADA
jgi:uncharacterized protein